MAFEGYALYPPLTIRDNIGFALLRERRPRDEVARRVGEIAGPARDRRHPRPLPAHDLGRPAAAHEPRPRPGPPRRDLAARRADVAARAAAARHPARADQGLSDRAQDDDRVRHPRPDRGDRPGRPDRGHGAGRAAAIRAAGRAEGAAGQPVRRELHRRAADEHRRCALAPGADGGWRSMAMAPDGRAAFQVPLAATAGGAHRPAGRRLKLGIRPHRIAGRRPAGPRRPPSSRTSGWATRRIWRSTSAAAFSSSVAHRRDRAPVGGTVPVTPAAGGHAPVRRRHRQGARCTAWTPRGRRGMSRDLIVGVDAGTSVIKAVAFDRDGRRDRGGRPTERLCRPAGRRRRAGHGAHLGRHRGRAARLWPSTCRTSPRASLALAVTGQGDGTWLIDARGRARGAGLAVARLARGRDRRASWTAAACARSIYRYTGCGMNACNQSAHLVWLKRHAPAAARPRRHRLPLQGLALLQAHRRARAPIPPRAPSPSATSAPAPTCPRCWMRLG